MKLSEEYSNAQRQELRHYAREVASRVAHLRGTQVTSGEQRKTGLWSGRNSWVTTDHHIDGWVLLVEREDGMMSWSESFGMQGWEHGIAMLLDKTGELLEARYSLSKRLPKRFRPVHEGALWIYENTGDYVNLGELVEISVTEHAADSLLRLQRYRREYSEVAPRSDEVWRQELGNGQSTGSTIERDTLSALERLDKNQEFIAHLTIDL